MADKPVLTAETNLFSDSNFNLEGREKNMKKRILIFGLILCMVVTMMFTGCSSDSTTEYDYDLSEYITLGEYKGIEVTPPSDKVEMRDTVNIDFVGIENGMAFEGGSTDPEAGGTNLTIGSGGYIPGFEDGLIGASEGDVVVLDLTFPDPYTTNKELSGKPVEFTVTINSIKKGNTTEDQIWDMVIQNAEVIKYPEKELAARKQEQYDYYESYATAYGVSFADFLSQQMGYTEEEFETAALEAAELMVKMEMALYAIADAEDISISDKEYEDGVLMLINADGYDDDAAFTEEQGMSYEDYVGKDRIMVTLLLDKVMTVLVDASVEVNAA